MWQLLWQPPMGLLPPTPALGPRPPPTFPPHIPFWLLPPVQGGPGKNNRKLGSWSWSLHPRPLPVPCMLLLPKKKNHTFAILCDESNSCLLCWEQTFLNASQWQVGTYPSQLGCPSKTIFDLKQLKREPTRIGTIRNKTVLYRNKSFDVSIELKQTEEQLKQCDREHILVFFQKI